MAALLVLPCLVAENLHQCRPTPRQALAPLNPFNRRHLFTTKIAMSNITLFYYSGEAP